MNPGFRWRRPTLALLSGALCDAALWRHQIAGLSDFADVRVADLTRDDNVAAMASRTLAALPPRFALAGLSLGGYVALEIMRRAPERVTKLALLDTTARPEGQGQEATVESVAGATERRGDQVALFTTLLINPKRLADRRLSSILGAMAERVGRKAFLRQQRAALQRADSRPALGAISCPTILICGRQDPLAPPALLQEMAAAIPGAQLLIIEDCGHLSPLEQPEAVTAALRRWMQSAQ